VRHGLFAALLACGLVLPGGAVAQDKPRLDMHRSAVNAIDASGWQSAVSTRGTFSVRMPIPFNDFSVSTPDPNIGEAVVHTIGGLSAEGIKISATEVPVTPRSKPLGDLAGFPEQIGRSPGTKISDIRRAPADGNDAISFLATGPTTSAFMRAVQTPKARYLQVIEFPNTQRDTAAAIKDEFFASFKLKN
jgi:hypothetical protein